MPCSSSCATFEDWNPERPWPKKLHETLLKEKETFQSSNGRLRVHQQNRYSLHRVLARMTDYVEAEVRTRVTHYV